MKTQKFLSEHGAAYEVLSHRATFSAQEMANAVHIAGDAVAKTVMVKADGEDILAVLPATHSVDLEELKDILNAREVRLTSESEFEILFPDCELGAVPPFGSQYGLRTIVDETLTEDEYIVFEGNTHYESIRMSYADYERLENPQVARFSKHL